jgi:hypothetical protein
LNQPEITPKSAYSKPALWGTFLTALIVTIGSLGPFQFRTAYGRFLNRHIQVYGIWYVTPHALMHILSFGLLGLLASLISERWPLRISGIVGVLILGLAIEWLQFRSHPSNPFETWDLRSDALGVCLGALLAYTWSAARGPSGEMFTA